MRKSSNTQSDLSQKYDLKTNYRVVVQHKDGKWIQGFVRFIGSHEKNSGPGPLIGIELVSVCSYVFCVSMLRMCICVHVCGC